MGLPAKFFSLSNSIRQNSLFRRQTQRITWLFFIFNQYSLLSMSDEYLGFDEIYENHEENLDEAWEWIKEYLEHVVSKMDKEEALECLYDFQDTLSVPLDAIWNCLPNGIDYDDESDVMACEDYYIEDTCRYLEELFDKKFGVNWEYSPELKDYRNELNDKYHSNYLA